MDYVIIGAGGHAKVLLEVLRLNALDAVAMVDANQNLVGKTVHGVPVFHEKELAVRFPAQSTLLVNAVGGAACMNTRKTVFTRYKEMGYAFATLVHPSATVSTFARLGEGVQLLAGSIISIDACIEADAIINTGACIDHDCHIGAHSHIAPGATLSGGVMVGEASLVGTGTSVIQNIHIGHNVTIGAGSTVIRDIPDSVVAAGCPCTIRKSK